MKRYKLLTVLLIFALMSSPAFAEERHEHERWGRGKHERTEFRGERFDYHEGRFYRPSLFGLILDLVLPPRGVVVTYLPSGYRTVYVGRTTYYEYENIYYQRCPSGYVVVDAPVVTTQYISPPVVYAPSPNYAVQTTQAQSPSSGTVIVNVPTAARGTIAITLVRYTNGFVGPQGEFYPTFPTTDELRARYGY